MARTRTRTRGKLLELFWQGPGGIDVKDGRIVPQGFVSDHTDHVHVATSRALVVAIGHVAQRMGLHVGEHPAFGGVHPVHAANSYHYRGMAIDVSGSPATESRFAHWVARQFGIGGASGGGAGPPLTTGGRVPGASASSGGGNAWRVTASAESMGGTGCGHAIRADGYSELSTVPRGASSDFKALGNLPCGTPLRITNPANKRSVVTTKQDNGAGSSFLPVMGLYPGTIRKLGLHGGRMSVVIERVDGGHLRPVRGRRAQAGRTRPGGASDGGSGAGAVPAAGSGGGGSSVDVAFRSWQTELAGTDQPGQTRDVLFGIPGTPGLPWDPLDQLKSFMDPINSVTDFLKFMAALFNPRNWLRAVELLIGMTFAVFGIHALIQNFRGVEQPSAARRLATEAISATPVGRGARVAKGARQGRQFQRAKTARRQTESGFKRGKESQRKRDVKTGRRSEQRSSDRAGRRLKRRGGQDDSIPF